MTDRAILMLERTLWIAYSIIAIAAAQLAWWTLDRDPPFEVLKINAVEVNQNTVRFDLDVRRDLDRGCSVEFSRHLVDAAGYRHDMSVGQIMDAPALAEMDRRMGGKLLLSMDLPAGMAVGPAAMTTVLKYSCNPLQNLWPIQVRMTVPFEVPR